MVRYVRVMSDAHPASLPLETLLTQCEVRHERRSGPGGQHRNKVATAVVLIHRPTGMRAEANERRHQAENLVEAVRRLRVRLAVEVRSAGTRGGRGSLWQSRMVGGRLAINPKHDDFPTILAEAMDVMVEERFDLSRTAELLEISMSQLIKFLKKGPAAWGSVCEGRRQRGLRPLH